MGEGMLFIHMALCLSFFVPLRQDVWVHVNYKGSIPKTYLKRGRELNIISIFEYRGGYTFEVLV